MLKKIYRLSDEGSRAVVRAGLCMALFNLACLLPVVPLAMVADGMLHRYFGDVAGPIPLWGYWAAALTLLAAVFGAYKLAYRRKYLTSGEEGRKLRMALADKIRRLPLAYLGRRDLSDLTTTIMEDVSAVEAALTTGASELIGGLLSGAAALVLLFFCNRQLTLWLAACLPAAALVMALCRLLSEGTNRRNKQKKLEISDGLQEYLENSRVLRASDRMGDYQDRLAAKIKRVLPGLILYELLAGVAISVSYNVMRLGLGLVILNGAALLAGGQISTRTFLLFLFAAVRVYEPLSKACEMLGELIYSLVSAQRIGELMDSPEQQGSPASSPASCDITFDHVSFGYGGEDVLHDVSFTARQGQITALVGPSGSGKTTLCKLAARFWDVQRGTVSLGGTDVRQIAPDTLLQNYAIVFQDVVLFNDTIYNNIRIGREDATREEVIEAARLAQCEEFIARLPQGYDTVIGENGQTLSGGERQRLSIARAFLKDAPVILLDESTASLDPENETRIQEAIGRLIENKTVLIIAHKLRSIVACDQIVVLEQGRVAERGTHRALMANRGLYHRLYTLQGESLTWAARA